jgi:hypothetical protein
MCQRSSMSTSDIPALTGRRKNAAESCGAPAQIGDERAARGAVWPTLPTVEKTDEQVFLAAKSSSEGKKSC